MCIYCGTVKNGEKLEDFRREITLFTKGEQLLK